MSEGVPGSVTLIGGRGDVFHNGRRLRKQEKVIRILKHVCNFAARCIEQKHEQITTSIAVNGNVFSIPNYIYIHILLIP